MLLVTLDELIEAQDQYRLPAMRDRFALAALPGVLAQRAGYTDPSEVAREAYALADAMMAAMGDGVEAKEEG